VNVLVTGGTGSVGRHVVRHLREAGHRAVVMSRNPADGSDWRQAELGTGAGVAEAVAGMDAIVHAGSATLPGQQLRRGRKVDVDGTRLLAEAAARAGVKHLVYVSIVGMEGVGYPYYKVKLAAEKVVEEAPLPWTIFRATQFHSLMEVFLSAFSRIPGLTTIDTRWRFQPVDASEVGARLAERAVGEAAGRTADFGGPQVRDFGSLAASWLKATGRHRRVVQLPLPFGFSRQLAAGRLLCPDHKDGKITFEQYLERRYPAARG